MSVNSSNHNYRGLVDNNIVGDHVLFITNDDFPKISNQVVLYNFKDHYTATESNTFNNYLWCRLKTNTPSYQPVDPENNLRSSISYGERGNSILDNNFACRWGLTGSGRYSLEVPPFLSSAISFHYESPGNLTEDNVVVQTQFAWDLNPSTPTYINITQEFIRSSDDQFNIQVALIENGIATTTLLNEESTSAQRAIKITFDKSTGIVTCLRSNSANYTVPTFAYSIQATASVDPSYTTEPPIVNFSVRPVDDLKTQYRFVSQLQSSQTTDQTDMPFILTNNDPAGLTGTNFNQNENRPPVSTMLLDPVKIKTEL